MIPIPRIRGRSGIADEGPDKGKWFYEITIWDLSGEHQVYGPIQLGPFISEDDACAAGRSAARDISEKFEGKSSGKYLDMKNGGILRPWENQS